MSKYVKIIINDILDLSKIEVGKVELKPGNVDIISFIAKLKNTYVHLVNNKKIVLKTEIDEEVPKEIFVDIGRLNQILANLIGNAFKFTKEGQIELLVKNIKADKQKVQFILKFGWILTIKYKADLNK